MPRISFWGNVFRYVRFVMLDKSQSKHLPRFGDLPLSPNTSAKSYAAGDVDVFLLICSYRGTWTMFYHCTNLTYILEPIKDQYGGHPRYEAPLRNGHTSFNS